MKKIFLMIAVMVLLGDAAVVCAQKQSRERELCGENDQGVCVSARKGCREGDQNIGQDSCSSSSLTCCMRQAGKRKQGKDRSRSSEKSSGEKIVYETRNGTELTLSLSLPKDKAAGPYPVLLYFGGGAEFAEFLNARGIAMASVRVRFGNGDIFPAVIQDAKSAVRFLRANAQKYNLDPDHIAASGSSKGGMFASMLGVMNDIPEFEIGSNLDQSSRVQAVINFCGHTDLTRFYQDGADDPLVHMDERTYQRKNQEFLGCDAFKCQEQEKKASVVTYVSSDDAPFLLITGANDHLVPVVQLERFQDLLQSAGVESTLDIVPGADHGFHNLFGEKQQKEIEEFLKEHLQSVSAQDVKKN